MSYSESKGIADFSNKDIRNEFIQKISSLLNDSVIISFKIKGEKNITFNIYRREGENYYDSEILFENVEIFFFRRFDTGMMRSGIHNLQRLDLNPSQKRVEHISDISYWRHAMSGNDGLQIVCYSGKMLRFLSSALGFKLEDGNMVENNYPTPKKVETPLTKLIYYSQKIIDESKELVDKLKDVRVNYDERDNALISDPILKGEKGSSVIFSTEFEEFKSSIDTEELTETQREKTKEILERIKREEKKYKDKSPRDFFEIYEF